MQEAVHGGRCLGIEHCGVILPLVPDRQRGTELRAYMPVMFRGSECAREAFLLGCNGSGEGPSTVCLVLKGGFMLGEGQ